MMQAHRAIPTASYLERELNITLTLVTYNPVTFSIITIYTEFHTFYSIYILQFKCLLNYTEF